MPLTPSHPCSSTCIINATFKIICTLFKYKHAQYFNNFNSENYNFEGLMKNIIFHFSCFLLKFKNIHIQKFFTVWIWIFFIY